MAMRRLKRAIDVANATPVKSLLESQVGGYERARSKKVIHASDLTRIDPEYCPREQYLMVAERVEQAKPYVGTAMRITFDDGVSKQWRVNNVYLRDRMVGQWCCRVCKVVSKWRKGPPSYSTNNECDCTDNKSIWEYKEPLFVHSDNGTTGSVDSLIDIGRNKLHMCELKIMATSLFPPKMPLAEHTLRTRLYLRLIEESNHPYRTHINTKMASVLYMCRGHGRKDKSGAVTPFAEFVVKRKDIDVDTPFSKAMAVMLSRKDKKMIPCGVCASPFDTRAKSCRVKKQCWSGRYKPRITWLEDGVPAVPSVKYVAGSDGYEKMRKVPT